MKKTECNALKKTPAIIKYREDYLFMLPYLLIFAIFTVFPVLVAMFFSLTRFDIVQLPHFTGLSWRLTLPTVSAAAKCRWR